MSTLPVQQEAIKIGNYTNLQYKRIAQYITDVGVKRVNINSFAIYCILVSVVQVVLQ